MGGAAPRLWVRAPSATIWPASDTTSSSTVQDPNMTTPRDSASLALLAALAVIPVLPAQISEYVVMAGDQSRFHVIRGGVLLRSWPTPSGTAQYQYPVVVVNTIR